MIEEAVDRPNVEQRLRESEVRLRLLMEASSDVLYRMSPDWGEMKQLDGGSFLPSTSSTAPLRSWLLAYIPDTDQAVVTAAIEEAIRQKTTFSLEHRVVRADGTVGWTLSRAVPLLGPEGEIVEWFGAASDISARREAEVALRNSEARLREFNARLEREVDERTAERDRIWEVSPDLQVVIDFTGVFRRVNPAWTTLLGYMPEDLVGHHVNEFVVAEDHDKTTEAYRATARGCQLGIENRYRHKDGSLRWISWVAVPAGHMTYATGRDVTAQRLVEAKLRDEQDFARLALSAVGGVGVWTYDIVLDRFFCDAAISDLYAVDPERGVSGVPREEFLANVHPEDREPLKQVMHDGLQQSGAVELEYRLIHPDGSIRWVLSKEHTYFDAKGQPMRRTGVGIDMTSQRQTEDQLRQSQKMEALGQLTGGIAHDFNNLLTIIRGSAEILQRPDLASEKRQRFAAAIADTADRGSKLTSQLLSFARRQTLTPEVFDVAASLAAISDMIGTLTGPRVVVDIDVGDCNCHVNADRTQFDAAIVNMAVNARDAMGGAGRLAISVRLLQNIPAVRTHKAIVGDFVVVTLTDTGPGIPSDKLDHIFEPFFTTKGVGQGTGLGLSQVFGFAKQSGGEVIATNADLGGASFALYLPRVVQKVDEAIQEDVGEITTSGDGKLVLVVEDNLEVGEFAMQVLSELGYRTRWVASGREALMELAVGNDIDLVLSDVVMPGMSGIELGREIEQLYPNLPVVLTSGYSETIVQSGVSGFPLLQKPYSIGSLSQIVQSNIINSTSSTLRGSCDTSKASKY